MRECSDEKISRMSGYLLLCDGQYVGIRGERTFKLLFDMELSKTRPLVLEIFVPQR